MVGSAARPLLVDELEIVGMRAVGAAAEPQRVEDGVLLGVGVLDIGEFPVQDLLGVDGHGNARG
jgi:hypothetical protein